MPQRPAEHTVALGASAGGLEPLRAFLRACGPGHGLGCVAVSAKAMPREIRRARAAGVDDDIVQPCTADRPLAAVARFGG